MRSVRLSSNSRQKAGETLNHNVLTVAFLGGATRHPIGLEVCLQSGPFARHPRMLYLLRKSRAVTVFIRYLPFSFKRPWEIAFALEMPEHPD